MGRKRWSGRKEPESQQAVVKERSIKDDARGKPFVKRKKNPEMVAVKGGFHGGNSKSQVDRQGEAHVVVEKKGGSCANRKKSSRPEETGAKRNGRPKEKRWLATNQKEKKKEKARKAGLRRHPERKGNAAGPTAKGRETVVVG